MCKGKTVKCISNRFYRGLPGTYGEDNYTCDEIKVGQVYEVIDLSESRVQIKNDKGHEFWYLKHIFEFLFESDKCNCPCHDPNVVMMHIMACCSGQCPVCEKYIKSGCMDDHKKTCLSASPAV